MTILSFFKIKTDEDQVLSNENEKLSRLLRLVRLNNKKDGIR